METLKKLLLASTLFLDSPDRLVTEDYRPEKMMQQYWANYDKEFLACVYGTSVPKKYYLPKQEQEQGMVSYESCISSPDYLGTIHSHLTHNDMYFCPPSNHDWETFMHSNDRLMGVVCHDKIMWFEKNVR